MVKYSFVFSIVLIIRLIPYVLTPISSSVVPGWHTTIYPPWFSFSIIQLVWLGVASVIYNYLERNGKVVSHKIFMIHIFLSLSIFLDNGYSLFDPHLKTRFLILDPSFLFLIAQIIFILGVLTAKKSKSTNKRA
jgi:hypothetical protein